MKIVFMGTPDFSVPILKKVNEIYGVDLVVTQPDKIVGRKKVITSSPVKNMAKELGIEVFQPIKIRKDYQRILDVKPDIIITAAYGQIIPKVLLDTPKYKAINVHGSLLPKHRGGAPIQRSLMNGDEYTGITIMYMGVKMDAGDIIEQDKLKIESSDTKDSLFEKLSIMGTDLLMKTLPRIFAEEVKPLSQNQDEVTYSNNILREEEKINWGNNVEVIDRHIRAFYNEPGMFTSIDDRTLKVYQGKIHQCNNFEKNHEKDANGKIIKLFDDGIGVKVNNGVYIITEVQLVGKKRMNVKDFLNGAGRNLITVGKVFK
ncbi:methionyl-tRNA formyltransferase [Candidatus Izimaplasma bacterium ZiA1]|uniref:methionyl-tRNA formyltransferase n=1 Tax=Candidatus Izimoplasma sp. ZiA1 TaxID=2024899 RepID=UPI000BAA5ED8|nr:methionyl-tRNA formyltransferase [Candidatus Izimaplasma bacterium ZiA1]